ncbi:hypothetical protein LSAT2_007193 [Lamellibrachia satsuma]|nr:hypothetical protein LSAT2_007193 [Lamellibrachia satsuma]
MRAGGETEESRGGETEESRGGETEENKESSGNVREKAGKKKKDDRRQRMQQKRGAKVEDIAEKAGQVMGGGTGGAVLVHVGTNNADKEGTSAIIGKGAAVLTCEFVRVVDEGTDAVTSLTRYQAIFQWIENWRQANNWGWESVCWYLWMNASESRPAATPSGAPFRSTEINECESSPCSSDGTCQDLVNRYRCACIHGYTGERCETEINICDGNPCKNGGTCHESAGKYECQCQAGTTGINCETDLANECASSPCVNGATCEHKVGGFLCHCVHGYSGDTCNTDVDECSGNPCQNGATCSMPKFDMYSCQCVAGYTGTNCETDIDECLSSPCENGGTCSTPQSNMFSCKCAAGYKGINCDSNVDECGGNPCQNGGTCQDGLNTYQCNCASGYTGKHCERDIDECLSSPCQNGATCSTPQINMFSCKCPTGVIGSTCETDINECLSSPCENGGTCSTPQLNMFSCKCAAGYTGTNCDSDIEECLSSPCQNGATCSTPHIDMFSCKCPTGVIGSTCETDFDECGSNPCQNGGKCQDGLDTYQCSCASGYNGTHCERGELCRNRPCKNGGTCTEIGGKRTCKCAGVFTGDSCEKSFPATLPASEKTRLTVSVKLLDNTFSNELSDKSSGKYKALKITVVEALKSALDVKLGPGKYEIDGVTFTSGSVVVTYEVIVPKNESTVMQSNIITAIKKHNGSFAGSAIDGNYVSTTETTTIRYYGQFRVPDLDYVENYGVNTSDEYVKLAEEVRFTLSEIYQADERVGSRLVNVTDVTFTKGSVIVDFFLWVDSTLGNWDVLQDILGKVPFSIGGHAVDLKSVRLSDKELEDADFPWLPVIIGSVLAVILLICVILLVVRNWYINRNPASSSSIDSHLYSPNVLRQDRLWQQTTPRNSIDSTIDPQYQCTARWSHNPVPKPARQRRGDQWSCSGSIVVTYEVVVPKNESTVIQSNIITAIKKHNDSFAGSAIDGNYVSIAETTTIQYYGQFRVPDLDYFDNYGVNTSDEKGSVIVDFILWVASTLDNKDVLQDILRNAPFSIGGHAVDLKSVRLSDKELEDAGVIVSEQPEGQSSSSSSLSGKLVRDKDIEDADFPWLPVILGSVLAVIVLTCVVILIVRVKCNTSRKTGCSSQLSSAQKAGHTTGSQSLSVRDEATSGRGQ